MKNKHTMSSSITEYSTAPIFNQTTGGRSSLSSLWKERPVVLLFLRRLGCSICRAYAKEMDACREEFEKIGVSVVALSFERYAEGSDTDYSFEKGNFWTGDIYSIDKEVYSELFVRKGLFDGFYGLMDINKAVRNKVRAQGVSGNLKGDGFQLGGQFVVNTTGEVVFEHRQKSYGDNAELDELLEAAKRAVSKQMMYGDIGEVSELFEVSK